MKKIQQITIKLNVDDLSLIKMKKNSSMPLKVYARGQCFSEYPNNFNET